MAALGGGLLGPTPPAAAAPAPPTDHELYVEWLYRLFLGREADAAGLAHWTAVLDEWPPSGVAMPLRRTPEAVRYRSITRPYVEILDRTPDADSADYWYGELRRGLPVWKVEANVLASAEMHALAGGTDAAWVRRLFGFVLGRDASEADVAYFTGRLAAGSTRGTIAGQVLIGVEGARRTVLDAYVEILDRSGADDPELAALVHMQRYSREVRHVEEYLASTEEAYEMVTGLT